MLDYLCQYIEKNDYHRLIEVLLLKNELGLACFQIILVAIVPLVISRVVEWFANQGTVINNDAIGMSSALFGFDAKYWSLLISGVLSWIVILEGVPYYVINECGLVEGRGIGAWINTGFAYMSLWACCFMIFSVIASIVLGGIEYMQKKNFYAGVSFVSALFQGIVFYCSLPDY